MKNTALALLTFIALTQTAHALPAESGLSRIGIQTSTFQEPLRLQVANGDAEMSIANYKGFFVSVERQKRFKGYGYGLGLSYGSGTASGGGTSANYAYSKGTVAWSMISLQPRIFMNLNEQMDLGISFASSYRTADWPDSPTIRVTATKEISAVFFVELNILITERFGFHQSVGFGSVDAGPFWKWGVNYDL